MRSAITVLALSLLIGDPAQAQGPDPVGEEFQVNTYTTSSQLYSSVAVNHDGDFVVVWMSYGSGGTDSSGTSIQLRQFSPDGTPVADDLQVNSTTLDRQSDPDVAIDGDGNFAVVWTSESSSGSDTSEGSIQLRRFTSDGNPINDDLQVNTYTTSYQHSPSIAASSDGDFVVVWYSSGSFGTDSGASIQGQRFAANGTRQGPQFQVNTYTTNTQTSPDVSVADGGDFVTVWNSVGSYGTDSSSQSIQAQRFSADGTLQGSQFQVNTYTTSLQMEPTVGLDGDGDFVVVWQSYGQDGDYWGIFGQRLDSTGTPVGSEFQVNTYTTSVQGYSGPELAVAAEGHFVVVWDSNGSFGSDSSAYSVQGQSFAADATPRGSQFQVNSYTTNSQGYYGADVGMASNGDFVVAWNSYGSFGTDTSSSSIQGQRFAIPIFTDGFESGDTSAWSNSVP